MPQERLPKEVLLAKANGRGPVGQPSTRQNNYIEHLGWNRLQFFLSTPLFGRKTPLNFGKDFFLFFWRSPVFGRKNRLNFGEDLLFGRSPNFGRKTASI